MKMSNNVKKCVFAGTFDPVTTGHEEIIEKCLKTFDEVVVAIMVNTAKTTLLTQDERVELLTDLYSNEKRVKIRVFDGAVVDLLQSENTPFYVRGVRNTVDFEYENQNHFANKHLFEDIITIYFPAEQDMLQVSSTLVKNSVHFAKEYADYIPSKIREKAVALLESKNVRKTN